MRRRLPFARWLKLALLGCLFVVQFLGACALHLDTKAAHRLVGRWLGTYFSSQLRGRLDLGEIEKLTTSTVWLNHVVLEDEQRRNVATLERVRIHAAPATALFRWLTRREPLTILIESVQADGVRLQLHLDPTTQQPSLLRAIEQNSRRGASAPLPDPGAYRLFLPAIELGEVRVESTLPSFITRTLRLRKVTGQLLITDQGIATSLKRFSLDDSDLLSRPLHVFGTLEYRSPRRIWGDLNLTVGQATCTGHFEYRKDVLALTIHPFRLSPAAAQQWFPGWALQQPAEFSLSAQGPLDNLGVRLGLALEPARIEAVGILQFIPNLTADLTITAKAIDLQAMTGAPTPSTLDATARVALAVADGQPQLHVDGVVQPGRLLALATPRIDLDATLDAEGFMISGRSRDPKLPVRAAAVYRNQELEVDAQLDSVSLADLLPAAWHLPSSGHAKARGKAKLVGNQLSATTDVTMENVAVAGIALGSAQLGTTVNGPVGDPLSWNGHLRLAATHSSLQGIEFDRITCELEGTPRKAQFLLTAEQASAASLRLTSIVSASQQPRLSQLKLDLSRGERKLSLAARALDWSNATLLLDGVSLDGTAGHAEGSIGIADEHIFGKLTGTALDLSAISELVGIRPGSVSGTANLEVALDTRTEPPKGSFDLEILQAEFPRFGKVSGSIDLQLLGMEVTGTAAIASDYADSIRGQVNLTLAGPLARPASYADAVGSLDVQINQARLGKIAQKLGWRADTLTVSGVADAHLAIDRLLADRAPNLALGVRVSALDLTVVTEQSPIRLDHADGVLGLNLQGTTGSLYSTGLLSRNGSPKLELAATTQLPPLAEFDGYLSQLSNDWRQVPFELGLHLPDQSLGELGETLGTAMGTGNAEVQVSLLGPIDRSHLVVRVLGRGLLLAPLANTIAFDAEGLIDYDAGGRGLRLEITAGTQQGLWASLNGRMTVQPCAGSLPCLSGWDGRAEANLVALPVGAFPALSSLGLNGALRGVLSARRNKGTTALDGLLSASNLTLSNHPLGQALFRASSDAENLILGATLIDGGAHLDVEAELPVDWREPLPKQRKEGMVRIAASAVGYDAGIISPWTENYLRDVEGELNFSVDGSYRLGRDAAATPSQQPRIAVNGNATLTRGKATLRDLGLTLNDISIAAQASSTRSRTTISIPTVSANLGQSAKGFSGSMVAELQDLAVQRVTGRVNRANELPLVSDSVTLATISGAADFDVTPVEGGHLVAIAFDDLEVHLPHSSARKTRSLAENPDIAVIQPLGPDSYRKQASTAIASYRLRFALGTRSRVTRSDFSLPISGTPEVRLDSRVRPQGNIELEPTGRLQLFGKSFAIDHGHITLNPEQPSNPQIDVSATWRGPTHLVTVQIQGTVEVPKLRLSSDPPLPSEPQIMALLLGGSGGDDSAAGAGLGVGATLFNELLSDTALSSVEVRTSTDERHANYTAAVPLRENLWFEATYHNSNNTSLTNSTVQNGFSGTVDYRFRRNWSLRTEVGTLGAGADLLWQYRY